MWTGDPEVFQEPRVDDPTAAAAVRLKAVRNAVQRELIGAGVTRGQVQHAEGWDLEGLPLGGRMLLTGSKNPTSVGRLWKWVRQHRRRRHWGALVTPAWGIGAGVEVRLPLEEFASILGKLDELMRERDAAKDDVRSDARR